VEGDAGGWCWRDSGVSQLWPVWVEWTLGLVGSLLIAWLYGSRRAWREVDCYHKGRKGQKGQRRKGQVL
jgi:hypothetical protein